MTEAIERGAIQGSETLSVRATLTIPDVLGELRIDGEIGLEQAASRE